MYYITLQGKVFPTVFASRFVDSGAAIVQSVLYIHSIGMHSLIEVELRKQQLTTKHALKRKKMVHHGKRTNAKFRIGFWVNMFKSFIYAFYFATNGKILLLNFKRITIMQTLCVLFCYDQSFSVGRMPLAATYIRILV